jgi:ATP-dependent protease Clp ATPase subunit
MRALAEKMSAATDAQTRSRSRVGSHTQEFKAEMDKFVIGQEHAKSSLRCGFQ